MTAIIGYDERVYRTTLITNMLQFETYSKNQVPMDCITNAHEWIGNVVCDRSRPPGILPETQAPRPVACNGFEVSNQRQTTSTLG